MAALTKPIKYDIAGSNIALLGSDVRDMKRALSDM